MQRKTQLLGASLLTLLGVAAAGAGFVSAQVPEKTGHTALVSALASAFGRSEDEVRAVFEKVAEERHQEKEAEHVARLNQLVLDGKITQAQADTLIAKHQEIKKILESRPLSEEQKQLLKEHHESLRIWLKEQGIDRSILHPSDGEHQKPHGHRGPFGRGR